jgi:hypothetical protein
LYGALVAALLAGIEHQNERWKHIFALPIERRTIFVVKWLVGLGLLFFSFLLLSTCVVGAAEMLRLAKPAWRSSPLPTFMIFRGAVVSSCAAALLFSIQMWISMRWRNFLPGLVLAIIALALMFVAIPHGVGIFHSFFPWSLPAMAMAPHNQHHAIAVC